MLHKNTPSIFFKMKYSYKYLSLHRKVLIHRHVNLTCRNIGPCLKNDPIHQTYTCFNFYKLSLSSLEKILKF